MLIRNVKNLKFSHAHSDRNMLFKSLLSYLLTFHEAISNSITLYQTLT